MSETCSHLTEAAARREPVAPSGPGCQECLERGGRWVHLRLCLTCGHVGCCDNSPGRHATAHHRETGHPVVRSYEPGERWAWCYLDETVLKTLPDLPGESAPRHYSAPPTPARPGDHPPGP